MRSPGGRGGVGSGGPGSTTASIRSWEMRILQSIPQSAGGNYGKIEARNRKTGRLKLWRDRRVATDCNLPTCRANEYETPAIASPVRQRNSARVAIIWPSTLQAAGSLAKTDLIVSGGAVRCVRRVSARSGGHLTVAAREGRQVAAGHALEEAGLSPASRRGVQPLSGKQTPSRSGGKVLWKLT